MTRVQGLCRRCGSFRVVEATPAELSLAVSLAGVVRGECDGCRDDRETPPCVCGHPKRRHEQYGCRTGLCRCSAYRPTRAGGGNR